MTRSSIIMCAVLAVGGALLIDAVYHSSTTMPVPNGEEHTMHDVQVLALGLDKFHYEFRDERGTVFWAYFCHDYEPQFSPGMTLTVLTYQDLGACWSVLNTHPAYLIKRDSKGKIIKEDFHDRRPEAAHQAH